MQTGKSEGDQRGGDYKVVGVFDLGHNLARAGKIRIPCPIVLRVANSGYDNG